MSPVAGAASTTWRAAGHASSSRSAGSVRAAPGTSRPRRVTAIDLDAERGQQADQRAADPAGADDRDRLAVERVDARSGRPRPTCGRARTRGAPCRPRASARARARPPAAPNVPTADVNVRSPAGDARRDPLLHPGRGQLHPAHGVGQRAAAPRGRRRARRARRRSSSGPARPPPSSTARSSSGRSAAGDVDHGTVGHESGGLPTLSRHVRRRDALQPMATVPLLSARGARQVLRRPPRARRARPRAARRAHASACSAPTAAASRRCCASSPAWSTRTRAT